MAQSLERKIELARDIQHDGCRAVFAAASKRGSILTEGCALQLIGKAGKIKCGALISDYFKAHSDDAALAPLLAILKADTLACYVHLDDDEQTSVESSLVEITVVEPSSEASATPADRERIKVLEAVLHTTDVTKCPQLRGLSGNKWKNRIRALCTSTDPNAEVGEPVDDGVAWVSRNKLKASDTGQLVAYRCVDAKLKILRLKCSPPTADALKKLKQDAFGDAYRKLVEVVEAAEDKAIQAMPSEGPALTEALKKRFAPRAEAVAQQKSDHSSKGATEKHRRAKEQGVVNPCAAAHKKNAGCTFGPCRKPKGDERAPNNNYPPYVHKRIEHDIAKATNITSWMKYEVSKKKKKNKKRRK